MPTLHIKPEGLAEEIGILSGIGRDYSKRLHRGMFKLGQSAVKDIKQMFRTGGTTDTRTAVRSGHLRASYRCRVDGDSSSGGTFEGRTVARELHIGVLEPGARGSVLRYARIQEGYDAQGNRVNQFIIRPRNKPWLVFPIRTGSEIARIMASQSRISSAERERLHSGGLAQSNILGWVRTKRVVLRPRPSFPYVQQKLPAQLQAMMAEQFKAAMAGGGGV